METKPHQLKILCPLVENPDIAHYLRKLPETTAEVYKTRSKVNRIYWLSGTLISLVGLFALVYNIFF